MKNRKKNATVDLSVHMTIKKVKMNQPYAQVSMYAGSTPGLSAQKTSKITYEEVE